MVVDRRIEVRGVPLLEDRQDALRVAAFLRISLAHTGFEKDYKRTVLNYFFNEYKPAGP